MTLINSNQQYDVSEQRRLPVDNVGSDESIDIAGETVQLYYYNAGVFTIDAGQAAATVVVGKLVNRNIKNALGDVTGTWQDSSLSFTSTTLTEEVAFPYLVAATNDVGFGSDKADHITDGFTNGQYCVDYRTGAIYGVKADANVTLTNTAYKIETSTAISPAGAASEVEIVDGSGNSASKTDDGAYTTGTDAVVAMGGYYSAADDTVDSGDAGILAMTENRHLKARIDGYDTGTDSVKGFEVSPLSSHHVEETLVNLSNQSANVDLYAYVDMDGYRNFSAQFQFTASPGTSSIILTLEATNQDDGTAADSCTYQDVTTALTGAASLTASGFWIIDTPVAFKYIRYHYVYTDGDTNCAWSIFHKKMY